MRRFLEQIVLISLIFSIGCTNQNNASSFIQPNHHILIAYFSRYGNTDYETVDATSSASILVDEDTFGTTEYVARMIQDEIGGDLHLIQVEQPYPSDFNTLRDLNHKEKANDTIPTLKETDLDITKYDTILIGYPIWASDIPQAIRSFIRKYDFTNKTVIPFCTHDGYGAGNSYISIQEEVGNATVLKGISIEAEDVLQAKEKIKQWLQEIGEDNS